MRSRVPGNRFGLPAGAVLRRYRERAIAVYRTDCDAAVTIDGSARIRVPGARARA